MKRLLVIAVVAVATLAALVATTLPPRTRPLDPSSDGTLPGVLHIHTNRSDGLSDPDTIAAAAARAGLKFIVFTDHGDAMRKPDPPAYRSGVLCLDAVEISTSGGHYLALDMPAAPYPLAGEARDVVEDVKRLGGFGIAAHPDSAKPELRWREWTAAFDGMELVNLDTGWRFISQQAGAAPKWRLFKALVDYPFRAPEVMASLIEPTGALYNWEALSRRRRVVVTAGADAHARLAWRASDPGVTDYALPLPGYESSLRVASVHVRPDRALSGDAASDAATVLRAIRGGHLYIAVDAMATPPSFEFTATNERGSVHEGDEIATGGPVLLHVRSNAPADFTTIVRSGLQVIASGRDASDLTVHAPAAPAVYWVEILAPGRVAPWIRSNPIYVRGAEQSLQPPGRLAPVSWIPIFDGKTAAGWHVEQDPMSVAALDVPSRVGGAELRLRYGLDSDPSGGPYAGVVFDTPAGLMPFDRLTVTARAERPMRLSVQLRAGAARWKRSIYIDTSNQEKTVFFDDLVPVGVTGTFRPPLDQVRSLLFVVDTVNTKPGSSGRLWIQDVELKIGPPN